MRILFAAHDPGGARALLPVMACARERGHQTILFSSGPASAIWRKEGEATLDADSEAGFLDAFLDDAKPDAALTGTSMHSDFERHLWPVLKARRIPALAVLDAWINLKLRFEDSTGQASQPDVIGVIDEGMAEKALAEPWLSATVRVLGQPHLESVAKRLSALRTNARRNEARPFIAFFSETVAQDHPGERSPGFDQYSTLAALLPALAAVAPCRLVVQPHPREDRAEVAAFLESLPAPEGVAVELSGMETERLLVAADAVIGMTTMVLVEAALSDIPGLSLQLNRKRQHNPAVDAIGGVTVVTREDGIPVALRALLHADGKSERPMPSFEGSAACIVDAVEALAP
ncbi:MAG: hypothetical protein OQJ99_08600 [Rhodospirillales bacterium]|nr:hypothetical protein [Rhodospirillales bacterium]MCW8861724.1 hypothetical protein [Rhodospirillales bacterium]MCW8952571.1 hypothetical protein [Rhodospirillales bacterium]MCW9002435.1 hypothetical protein [Rhodospirillales bacterium]MCW9040009.1 hypothetical protein [Rhodospirillales bacterium]